jgi:hypothetical protein
MGSAESKQPHPPKPYVPQHKVEKEAKVEVVSDAYIRRVRRLTCTIFDRQLNPVSPVKKCTVIHWAWFNAKPKQNNIGAANGEAMSEEYACYDFEYAEGIPGSYMLSTGDEVFHKFMSHRVPYKLSVETKNYYQNILSSLSDITKMSRAKYHPTGYSPGEIVGICMDGDYYTLNSSIFGSSEESKYIVVENASPFNYRPENVYTVYITSSYLLQARTEGAHSAVYDTHMNCYTILQQGCLIRTEPIYGMMQEELAYHTPQKLEKRQVKKCVGAITLKITGDFETQFTAAQTGRAVSIAKQKLAVLKLQQCYDVEFSREKTNSNHFDEYYAKVLISAVYVDNTKEELGILVFKGTAITEEGNTLEGTIYINFNKQTVKVAGSYTCYNVIYKGLFAVEPGKITNERVDDTTELKEEAAAAPARFAAPAETNSANLMPEIPGGPCMSSAEPSAPVEVEGAAEAEDEADEVAEDEAEAED